MKLLSAFIKTNVTSTRNLSYAKVRTWYANLVKPKPVDPPYRHVVQIGDPTLRVIADAVPLELINSSDIQNILKRMYNVFHKYNCIGLSATQIGVPYRIFMMEFSKKNAKQFTTEEFNNKEMSLMPFTIVVNPEMKVTDYKKVTHIESCESVKGFYADVPRYHGVQITGIDDEANPVKIDANGWIARIIQHEMDHMNGKLYTDIMDRKSFTCSCWEVVNERSGRVQLPYSPH